MPEQVEEEAHERRRRQNRESQQRWRRRHRQAASHDQTSNRISCSAAQPLTYRSVIESSWTAGAVGQHMLCPSPKVWVSNMDNYTHETEPEPEDTQEILDVGWPAELAFAQAVDDVAVSPCHNRSWSLDSQDAGARQRQTHSQPTSKTNVGLVARNGRQNNLPPKNLDSPLHHELDGCLAATTQDTIAVSLEANQHPHSGSHRRMSFIDHRVTVEQLAAMNYDTNKAPRTNNGASTAAHKDTTTSQRAEPSTAEASIKEVQALYTFGVRVGLLKKDDRVGDYLKAMRTKYRQIYLLGEGERDVGQDVGYGEGLDDSDTVSFASMGS